ncbi:MAG: hypothetical protein QNJ63_21150 [Calothrix sp. MO_192.B10]|nr:hypothetical protein [Calothrix sp. MO_192.B10]
MHKYTEQHIGKILRATAIVNRFAEVKSQKSKVKSMTPSMNRGA